MKGGKRVFVESLKHCFVCLENLPENGDLKRSFRSTTEFLRLDLDLTKFTGERDVIERGRGVHLMVELCSGCQKLNEEMKAFYKMLMEAHGGLKSSTRQLHERMGKANNGGTSALLTLLVDNESTAPGLRKVISQLQLARGETYLKCNAKVGSSRARLSVEGSSLTRFQTSRREEDAGEPLPKIILVRGNVADANRSETKTAENANGDSSSNTGPAIKENEWDSEDEKLGSGFSPFPGQHNMAGNVITQDGKMSPSTSTATYAVTEAGIGNFNGVVKSQCPLKKARLSVLDSQRNNVPLKTNNDDDDDSSGNGSKDDIEVIFDGSLANGGTAALAGPSEGMLSVMKMQRCHSSESVKNEKERTIIGNIDQRDDQVPCKICRKLLRRASLERHVNSVHLKVRYFCRYCNKSYTQSHYLRTHEAAEHGVNNGKLIQCDNCLKPFTTKQNLGFHKQKCNIHINSGQ